MDDVTVHKDETLLGAGEPGNYIKGCKPICPEPIPCNIDEQLQSRNFIAYSVVSTFVLFIIVYIIMNVIGNYIIYSHNTGFPDEKVFIVGTLFMLIFITYGTYNATAQCPNTQIIFWGYVVFLTVYVIWVLNLTLRAEYHVRGADIPIQTEVGT